mmetsp:Transcript_7429/g.15514  ORF Transcript_7429/g.15514 Transcript_7429/m.15514 type:complete len:204 (-) Transcript_7429:358-969(-)
MTSLIWTGWRKGFRNQRRELKMTPIRSSAEITLRFASSSCQWYRSYQNESRWAGSPSFECCITFSSSTARCHLSLNPHFSFHLNLQSCFHTSPFFEATPNTGNASTMVSTTSADVARYTKICPNESSASRWRPEDANPPFSKNCFAAPMHVMTHGAPQSNSDWAAAYIAARPASSWMGWSCRRADVLLAVERDSKLSMGGTSG